MGRLPAKLAALSDMERFWLGVVRLESGCWERITGRDSSGYAWFWTRTEQRRVRAHRWIYEQMNGPLGELHVLHSCDNPPCVRPEHLRAGTHWDNMQDRKERDRGHRPRGELQARAKLTAAQVAEIRRRYVRYARSGPDCASALAREFGVSVGYISVVARGRKFLAPAS